MKLGKSDAIALLSLEEPVRACVRVRHAGLCGSVAFTSRRTLELYQLPSRFQVVLYVVLL